MLCGRQLTIINLLSGEHSENLLRQLPILHCVSQHDAADQLSRLAAVSCGEGAHFFASSIEDGHHFHMYDGHPGRWSVIEEES